jgi:NADH-quinone oxidoreductase subunit I
MLYSLKGLWVTLVSTFSGLRQPVTRQYPDTGSFWKREDRPTPVQPRFMGFPALTWDGKVDEPYCTGCMVCIRNCPTLCMSATMKDNPLHGEGHSHRRKIVDSFEINLNRCILCGICVEVCNFDAIAMSHEHELSAFQRNGARMDLPALLELGQKFQEETGWIPPTQRAKKAEETAEGLPPETEVAAASETEDP